MDDESKQMHVDSLNVQVSNLQSLKDCLSVIKHAGSSGKGFPYAPEDFPSPGDVWTWRVGKRYTHTGFWKDRSVHPPDRLQSSTGNKMSFRGRASLEQYIRKTFPDADVDAFFASFVWKIPCTDDAKDASLKAIKSKGCSKSAAVIRPGNCKASNEMCRIKAKTRSALTPATCNICCSEPNFCRYCCCILCSKTIDWIYDGYSFIKCEALVDENFICGHVAHIECALRAYLAGKVGGIIDLDAQYYCRCCDNKTDLLLHVEKIIKVSESIDNREDLGKVLNLGFCMLLGSEKEGAEKLRNHIATSFEKLKHGVPSEDIWKKRSEISELERGTMTGKIGFACTKESTSKPPLRKEYTSKRSLSREPRSSSQRSDRGESLRERRIPHKRPRSRSPPHRRDDRRDDRSWSSSGDNRRDDMRNASSHVLPPPPPPRVPPVVPSQSLSTWDRGPDKEKSHLMVSAASGAQEGDVRVRMETLKRAFPEIDFEDNIFVPNLKRIPQEVQDNTIACVVDACAQYNECYRMAKRVSESNRKLRVELTNAREMEVRNENVISDLRRELEEEQRVRIEDVAKAKQKLKQIEDSREILRGELGAASSRNHQLSERIKLLKAQLETEKKAREKAEEDGQEYCNRVVDAEIKIKEALDRVVKTEQRVLDMEREVVEARRSVEEDPGAMKKRLEKELEKEVDEVITKYNANVIRFRSLSWYGDKHAQALAEAWDQVVKDELVDSDREGEFDETKLEEELLEDFEIEALHEWRLSRPKTSMEAGEASVSSPASDMEASFSVPATATTDVPATAGLGPLKLIKRTTASLGKLS